MHTSVKKIAELENELIVIYLLINFVWRCMVDLYLKFHPSTLKDWWDWLYFIFKGTNINLLCKNAEETKMRKKHYKKGMIHSEFYKHFHRSSFSFKKTFSFSFYRVRIISYIFTNNKIFFFLFFFFLGGGGTVKEHFNIVHIIPSNVLKTGYFFF